MYKNHLKQSLAEGRPAMGISFQSESPITAEVVARSGIDYVMIDLEHGPLSPLSYEKLWVLCRIFHGNNVTPIAKVPSVDAMQIAKVLDAGVMGIVLPHCSNREQTQALVKACFFPPAGDRGASPVVPANNFVDRPTDAFVRSSNAEVMAIPLIEDREGVENLDQIAGVEGVAAIRVARNDLSLSYGVHVKDPSLVAVIETVIERCLSQGMPVDVNERTPAEIASYVQRGVKVMSTFGVDHFLLHDACRERVEGVRSALGKP